MQAPLILTQVLLQRFDRLSLCLLQLALQQRYSTLAPFPQSPPITAPNALAPTYDQWAKLFVNLRSSCITDMVERSYTEKTLDAIFGNTIKPKAI